MQDDWAAWKEENIDEIARDVLAHIPASDLDPDNYRDWITAGMALKDAGVSFDVWAEWSARSAKYDPAQAARQWDKFKTGHSSARGSVGLGSLYQKAQRAGWTWADARQRIGAADLSDWRDSSGAAGGWYDRQNVLVYVDRQTFTQKPSGQQSGGIRNREPEGVPMAKNMTVHDFAQAVTAGQTFMPCNCIKRRREDGTADYVPVSQQLFIVDVDNEKSKGVRADKVLDRQTALRMAADAGAPVSFSYETFSSKKHRADPEAPYTKFRLCWIMDRPVRAEEGIELVRHFLAGIFTGKFPQSIDTGTMDAARLIYGTDEHGDRAQLHKSGVLKWAEIQKKVFTAEEPAADPAAALPSPSVSDLLPGFLAAQEDRRPGIRTGLHSLDLALCGGFQNELYTMTAATGIGKSAIAFYLAQNIARQRTHVLYFALEMSAAEFLARGISSATFRLSLVPQQMEPDRQRPVSYGAMIGEEWDDTLQDFCIVPPGTYREAAVMLDRECGPYLHIIECGMMGTSAGRIAETVRQFKNETGADRVCVFVDYLQLLDAEEDHARDDQMQVMSRATRTLKALASQKSAAGGCTVFCLSSQATSRNGQRVTEGNAKYSGDISYSTGVSLGWNWKGYSDTQSDDEKLQTAREAKRNGYRLMYLDVLKQRNNDRDTRTWLKYYPAYNYFEPQDPRDVSKIFADKDAADFGMTKRDAARNKLDAALKRCAVDQPEKQRTCVSVLDLADELDMKQRAVRESMKEYGYLDRWRFVQEDGKDYYILPTNTSIK